MGTTEQNWKQDYLDLREMYTEAVAERDTLAGENDLLLEGKVQDAETIHVLEQALTKCVESLDQLLPYLAKVPADVGLLNDALVAARPLVESGPVPASDEQSPEQMLSREQIENIARKVHGECIRLPGATYQHAAEAAVMYTLERIARRQGAEPECGNCFEGKSNMDHVCRKCGGSGKAEQAQAQDERQAFEAWMVEVEGARIRPRFDRVTAGPFADEYRDGRIQGAWNVWQARAARPAQTEQQPVATWMGTDWNAQQQLIAHLCKLEPGTDLYAAPIAQAAKRGEA
ncbi:MAG: hypothetical protein H5U32_02515 [Pseudomonas balearica]|uniref:hypothetical protein n=1 Tax=Stutzerimonas balearica TaxID=74829 RepID=UPI0019CC9578|nr:hypothetical protein [Stutzerimonas balearica]MBC7198101.1 hypothetical protein [Stutzerimonas balearica]